MATILMELTTSATSVTLNVPFANLTPVSARVANLKASRPAIYWVMSVLIYAPIALSSRTALANPVTPVA